MKSNSRKPKFQPYYCVTSHRGGRWSRQRTRSENNADESEESMSQEGILEYNTRMDCEIIHEKNQMDLDQQNSNNAAGTSTKEFSVPKIKRSKSLDNILLKSTQDLVGNSSTLEFPSFEMISRFRELQFNE